MTSRNPLTVVLALCLLLVSNRFYASPDYKEVSGRPDVAIQNTPWIQSLDIWGDENATQRLHDEVIAFSRYTSPTATGGFAREQVYDLLYKLLQKQFNRSQIDVFGSAAQGLVVLDGSFHPSDKDTDILVMTRRSMDSERMKDSLYQLSMLINNAGLTDYVEVRYSAKVPIVNFQTTPAFGCLRFDISFNSQGLPTVPIVRKYVREMPALRLLLSALKSFMKQRKLSRDGGINDYALLDDIILAGTPPSDPRRSSSTSGCFLRSATH
ncbi:hypothetical protein HYDPIDRAFT_171365 [Hydnomerulius pinastri MD-312]|uniref:Unplaced genomic scaffold scaffold_137, whole genome shotgun sequence n=1 Tax=Hydnomerulius pinastri MD-312 TaxID=994086 RepID=A0A0C9VKY3_9AGAM|nr:hypothetical protein HYDPIDRAFT_171365 [Hydnomerulius pinastri MD-312]